MNKKNLKRTKGLRRWNKVFSKLIKDYKKRGENYDISKVRKEASEILPDFKNISPSKISKKKVVESKKKVLKLQKKEIEIKASEIPEIEFEGVFNWYMLGEKLSNLSRRYPEIPIMIISKKFQEPLVSIGFSGSYDGSDFQKWVEDVRASLTDPNKSSSWDISQFFGTPAIIEGKEYAVFYEDGEINKIPKIAPPISKLPPKKKKEIKKREEKEIKRKKDLPKILKPLPPPSKKKPKKEKKSTKRDLEIKRAIISDLREDKKELTSLFRDKLITKKEFFKELKVINKQISNVTEQLKRGGKI